MAARKNLPHIQKTRDRIQASMLINRLEDHALGKVELTQTQVAAIKVLLNKTIPDVSSVSIDAEVNGHVDHNLEVVITDATTGS